MLFDQFTFLFFESLALDVHLALVQLIHLLQFLQLFLLLFVELGSHGLLLHWIASTTVQDKFFSALVLDLLAINAGDSDHVASLGLLFVIGNCHLSNFLLKIVDVTVSLVHSSSCFLRLENMCVLMASHSAFLEGLHYSLSVDPLFLLGYRSRVRF